MRISDWSSDVCSSDLASSSSASTFSTTSAAHGSAGTAPFGPCAPSSTATVSASREKTSAMRSSDASVRRSARSGGGDRKSVVWGKSVSVRVDLGGRRFLSKKKNIQLLSYNSIT